MKIVVDAMGGDNAPLSNVQGALDANRLHGIEVVLVGKVEEVLKAVEACGEKTLPAGIEIRDAREVVEICDDPATAFKKKKDSSLTVGLTMVKNGEGDAFVSAGSTGALLAGATLLVKRIRGIRRAAMGPAIPVFGGKALLCDCGANADCTPTVAVSATATAIAHILLVSFINQRLFIRYNYVLQNQSVRVRV